MEPNKAIHEIQTFDFIIGEEDYEVQYTKNIIKYGGRDVILDDSLELYKMLVNKVGTPVKGKVDCLSFKVKTEILKEVTRAFSPGKKVFLEIQQWHDIPESLEQKLQEGLPDDVRQLWNLNYLSPNVIPYDFDSQ